MVAFHVYDAILIPTDGSNGLDTVPEHGLTIADRFDAKVHVLHIVDQRAYASVPEDVRDRVRETLEAVAQDATKAVAERSLDTDIYVVREVRWGNPPASILAYEKVNDVNLIVMARTAGQAMTAIYSGVLLKRSFAKPLSQSLPSTSPTNQRRLTMVPRSPSLTSEK